MRGRILDAARTLFEASGYQATTVAGICEQADVAYKTFFNHFESKHALLLEIEQEALEGLLAHFDTALALPGSTRERLAQLFEGIAREAEAAGPMHRELLTELIHSVHARGDEPEQVRRVEAAARRLVEAGREQGDVRRDQPVEILAEAIRGTYYVLVISFGNLNDYPVVERARGLAALLAESLEGPHA